MSSMAEPKPFKIDVPDSLLNFINQRVATARIPPSINLPEDAAWAQGVPSDTISQIRSYWEKSYDWRAVEARINSQLKMYTLPIEEGGETITMHFVHHRSSNPNAIPLLFQHGWPGSFLEVRDIIHLLTSPKNPDEQAYHVVAPSLPGFVFSSMPQSPNFNLKSIAVVNHKLMQALGYKNYMGQGGDWGSMIVRIQALTFPQHCSAVHLNMVVSGLPVWWRYPFHFLFLIFWVGFQLLFKPKGKNGTMFNRMVWFIKEESGYQEIQGTKPQTVSYALVDSPLGMLAWIRDKLEYLVDDDYVWTDEEVITWAMMYIIPGSSGHAAIYRNAKGDLAKDMTANMARLSNEVDIGYSIFPKDAFYIPRWWANCTISSNILMWKEHAKGGHFPSTERPDVLAKDIREFTALVRRETKEKLRQSGKVK